MKILRVFLAALGVFAVTPLFAQGTAFTYQGRLNASGGVAAGLYDFRFRLATDVLGNNYVGSAFLTNGLPVSSGLFTATIDFGAGLFTGTNYWLEIGVRTNGAGGYTVLAPLQAIAPTPYAVMANSASNLLGALPAGQLSGTIASGNLPASPAFSGTVTATAFSGNGANVTNVNAAALNGLNASNFWKTGGNGGTTAGNFVGTTDNQPLELRVNGQRALRLEPGGSNSVNVIGGNAANSVPPGTVGATVGGGGAGNYQNAVFTNRADANFSTVAGGGDNSILANSTGSTISGGQGNMIHTNAILSTIAGGNNNFIGQFASESIISGGIDNSVFSLQGTISGGYMNSVGGGTVPNYSPGFNFGQLMTIGGGAANYIGSGAEFATISGGLNNHIYGSGIYSTIAGGQNNSITNSSDSAWATIGGGLQNSVVGDSGTVPGGFGNSAGDFSFAAGTRAKATNAGTFAWADSQNVDFRSTSNNQFIVRAANGVGINTNSPGATLDVNGTFRVGSGTTVFKNLQGGLAQMTGGSGTAKTNFTFNFPKTFTSTPNVILSARSGNVSPVDDTFAVTVRAVTATSCTVNVVRVDNPSGWSQQVIVNWLAWE